MTISSSQLSSESPVSAVSASRFRKTDSAATYAGLVALAAGHFAVDVCTGIWPVYKTIAHLDVAKAGLIATLGSLVANGLQVAFGVVADRGFRRACLIGGLLLAGCVSAVPYTQSYAWLFLLVFGTGIGSAIFHPSATGTASGFSHSRKGVFIAIFLAGGYLGYAVSQILFTSIYYFYHKATIVLMTIPILAAVSIIIWVRQEELPTNRKSLLSFLPQIRNLAPLFGVQSLSGAVQLTLVFLLPDFLSQRNVPNWMSQGGAHFALILGGCLSLLPAGYASDRWGTRGVLIAANAGTGTILAFLLLAPLDLPSTLLAIVAFGICNGANGVVAISEGNRLLPGQASAVSAILMGLPWCVSALSPLIAGNLANAASGGSAALALGWFTTCIPVALLISLTVSDSARKKQS